MKAPITLLEFGKYALASALFVVSYTVLGHLIETLSSPKTIKDFIVLFVLSLGLSVVFHIYMNRRKKSSAQSEAQ